jgi:hypothetical protein
VIHMEALFTKPWWQVGLLIVTFSLSISFVIWFVITIVKATIKVGGFIFGPQAPVAPPRTSSPTVHHDYIEFGQIQRELNILLKNMVRGWCIHNGMGKLEGRKWDEYRKTRLEQVGTFAFKFSSEAGGGFQVLSIPKFMEAVPSIGQDMRDVMATLFEDLRSIAVDQSEKVAKKKADLEAYMFAEERRLEAAPTTRIIPTVLKAGRLMIEIHELENRELVRRQMSRVDELFLTNYNQMCLKYLTALNKALKESEADG